MLQREIVVIKVEKLRAHDSADMVESGKTNGNELLSIRKEVLHFSEHFPEEF